MRAFIEGETYVCETKSGIAIFRPLRTQIEDDQWSIGAHVLTDMNQHWDKTESLFKRNDGENTWPWWFTNSLSIKSRETRQATEIEMLMLEQAIEINFAPTEQEIRDIKIGSLL
jgi:hypothetical protein